ncbi:DUF5958 family protein [Streptomyces sp. NPDC046977]
MKAFRPLVALLGVADKRRRERFRFAGCTHAWHQARPAPARGMTSASLR